MGDYNIYGGTNFLSETLLPHDLYDYKYWMPNIMTYDEIWEDKVGRTSRPKLLDQEKPFKTNEYRQYANFGLLFVLFFVSGFGENGLLTNKLHTLHKYQWRRGFLCLCCLMATFLMKISSFYKNWFFVADKENNLLAHVGLVAFKVFMQF